jgi:two-component system OmpR family sensor kinase
MSSLRQRLLSSLWLTLALVGSLCAAFTYFRTQDEINSLLDYQMQQVATFVGAHSFSDAQAARLSPLPAGDRDDEDGYSVSVRDADGRQLYASGRDMTKAPADGLGFRTIKVGEDSYRVFVAKSGTKRITVGQQIQLRQETATAAALIALLPVLVLIPLLGVVISLVIRRQLRPLHEIAREVAGRASRGLEPLPVAGLPTEIRPLIDELNHLLARLRTASEHEQRFIADAAHALRTPLAALQLQADVLDGSTDATERAARTAELRSGIRRVVRLSNHLLHLVRAEPAGGPIVSQIAIDHAMTEAYELYAPIAQARGLRLDLSVECQANVPGDARHLAQIIGNLLDNALRHTPTGGTVNVRVDCDPIDLCISVIDEGPGLPESELDKVFARFYRAPGDVTEGSGLGLAVVRNIVGRLGGRTTLENRVDRHGLIARAWLPLVGTSAPTLNRP